ncbi:MAG: winged helix-turn-helix transcriptional regulator [Caulobacteraceae bacterium]|nr:winged helix-turn-helix transcriptional regulator [Caulobacteraceae bacterium]
MAQGASSQPASVGADRLSLALAALAHPVRRDLLALIEARPQRVTELASGFSISLPAVSRHLKVLETAGLVQRTIDGRDHFIARREAGLEPVADWVARQSGDWARRLFALKGLLERAGG